MDKLQPITRRAALIGALVSTAALAAPAIAGTMPDSIGHVVDRHRAAAQAYLVIEAAYDEACKRAELPELKVQISRHHYSGRPSFASTDREVIEWFDRCKIGVAPIDAGAERRKQQCLAELQSIRDRRHERAQLFDLDRLSQCLEDASNAEYDAFAAVIAYAPSSIKEMKAKALYLIEVSSADDYDRLTSWGGELLASFAGIPPVFPASEAQL